MKIIEYDIVIKITETFHLRWEFHLIYFPDALEILRPVRTQALGERDYYGLLGHRSWMERFNELLICPTARF